MTVNPTNQTTALHAGAKVDKFEILEQVGAGGMSIVWKGYDRLLDRFVALKQLLPGGPDAPGGAGDSGGIEAIRERFRAEAELHKRVSRDNRHIVRVLEFLDEPRGLFIVMEYVDGSSLEQVLLTQPDGLDERRALGVVGATALALESIHDQSILHRDLKPSNILLPRQGGLKVTDFGLAAFVAEQDVLTLGSVRYMAPELFGDEPADARADIYSLGMITYEMLAGRARFDEAFKMILRDQRNQGLRWMKWHTNLRVKAPPLTQVNPAVSPTLAELVERMMAKDPAARISSAPELLAAIRRHFAAEATPVDHKPVRRVALGFDPAGTSPPGHGGLEPVASPVPSALGTPNSELRTEAGTIRVVSAAPPTAPLPRRGRLMRGLLIALAAEILLGLAATALYLNMKASQARAKQQDGKIALAEPRAEYDAHHLVVARTLYEVVADHWLKKGPAVAAKARAMAWLCSAQLDLEQGKFDAAQSDVDKAAAEKALNDDGQTYTLVADRVKKAASFAKVAAKASDAINTGDLALAASKIAELRNSSPTAAQLAQINQMDTLVHSKGADLKIDHEVRRILDDANRLVAQDKRDQAIATLNEAFAQYRSPVLQQRAEMISRRISYDRALADGQDAEKSGDLKAALDGFTRAQALQPNDETATHIQVLRSQVALAEGRRLLEAGDKVGAAAAFEQSNQAHENPEAQAALKDLKIEQAKEVHIRAGDGAAEAGDFAAAIEHYKKALETGPDAAVTAKIDSARTKLALGKAREALTQGKLDDAAEALKAARAVGGSDAATKKTLDDLDKQVGYRRLINAGDAARKESRFGDAIRSYRKARDLISNAEVNGRINDTEYAHLIAQARTYAENQVWPSAKAEALSASKLRDTAEVKQLLADIETHMPATPAAGAGGGDAAP